MITELDGLAYSTYKTIVEDICTRRAFESEIEQILDYMVGMCNNGRMLGVITLLENNGVCQLPYQSTNQSRKYM